MRLVSVNVATPRAVHLNGRSVLTGIFKSPVDGVVTVNRRNLAGDRQADLRVHGGIDKAVYAYPVEHYTLWARELGRTDFTFGQFGENLTIEGLTEDAVRIGDRFRIGSAVLEVSQPRFPCYKLGIRMNDPSFVKRFLNSRRSGFYLRVIDEGALKTGDAIDLVYTGTETIQRVNEITFGKPEDLAAKNRLLEDPALAPAWKNMIREFSGS